MPPWPAVITVGCALAAGLHPLLPARWAGWFVAAGGRTGSALGLVLALAVLGTTLARLRANPRDTAEHASWQRLLIGAVTIEVSVVAGQLAGLVLAPRTGSAWMVSAVTFGIGGLIACPLFYMGLVRWNRTRTQVIDPGDWLNGLSAALVLVAIGNAVLPGAHAPRVDLTFWQFQLALATIAGAFIAGGTAISVAFIAGLARDPRIWLATLAMATLFGAHTGLVRHGLPALAQAQLLGLLSAAAVSLAAARPNPDHAPQPATTQATTMGSLVVLLSGVATLIAAGWAPESVRPVVTGFAAFGVVGVSARFVGLVHDLANLARSRQEALTDELTGIANRRALMTGLEAAIRAGGPACLMIIDLDRFKAVNDRFGHAAGDQLLCLVSADFAAQVPAGGLLGRLGGDEFAVLLTGPAADRGPEIADRLAGVTTTYQDDDGRPHSVTASVGVARLSDDEELTGGELLRRADVAMFRAKSLRAGVGVYDQALDALAREQEQLSEELQLMFRPAGPAGSGRPADQLQAQEQVQVWFQPQIDLGTGSVVGAEALVRWGHPRLGLLTPDRFLELVEQAGLMLPLTVRVLRQAVIEQGRWRVAGHALRVSVNVSASCLTDPDLLTLVDEALADGLDPADLVLEITETSLMTDPEAALIAVRALAKRGVGISIDDYGTGYSSLSYLNDLPATELKIDRSFTSRVLADPRTVAIVTGTVELGHRLDMRLVAEGVEDEATLRAVRAMGCDESQGYLHAKPLPAESFLTWLGAPLPAIMQPSAPHLP